MSTLCQVWCKMWENSSEWTDVFPALWAQQCSCVGEAMVVFPPHTPPSTHTHSPYPSSSLSFLPIICPPHTPNPRGLHLRKKAAGRVMLIPGHESLRAGFHHLAPEIFLWWMSILWPLQIHDFESLACGVICTMHSYCCSLEATWRHMRAAPECQ